MKDKKLVVYYIPATRFEALERMLVFIHNLNAANIKICKIDTIRLQFETNNLLIKYITDHKELIGISPAEIFGSDYNIDSSPLIMAKLTDHPYPGTMMDYIIDTEKVVEAEENSMMCNRREAIEECLTPYIDKPVYVKGYCWGRKFDGWVVLYYACVHPLVDTKEILFDYKGKTYPAYGFLPSRFTMATDSSYGNAFYDREV